jgi:type II restriction enzyme
MARSEQLRANKRQHVVKNTLSKGDDKKVVAAMERVIIYMNERLPLQKLGYKLVYVDRIKLADLIEIIKSYETRFEFATLTKDGSFIKPDGGILILRKSDNPEFQRIVLAVEMKRQGTNDARAAEGMTKQAQGNAIERLGKNLIGFRSALQYERITPFICFGWGVDFAADSSILDRVITMNEFYPLNRTFVFKREDYAPVSMYFRAEEWDVDELYSIMREIAETSVRYYIF